MSAAPADSPGSLPDKKDGFQELGSEEDAPRTRKAFLPGPPCVRNIIMMEACERYCYYGMRAILVIFLNEALGFDENTAISIYAYALAGDYFFPLLGGTVSDSWLAKYKTILSFGMVYCVGCFFISLSAIGPWEWATFVGLGLIATGTGGIKPCVSSFGADQFSEAEGGDAAIRSYFSVFYFAINTGSVGSYLITPLIRRWFGFAPAFGMSFVLLLGAIFIFWRARKQYFVEPPAGSVMLKTFKIFAAGYRGKKSAAEAEPHWIDHAKGGAFSEEDISNAKAVWRILPIFAVLPAFWMLFDQQGSAWIFQARKMELFGIQPEQVGICNSMMVLLLVPLLDKVVYPFLQRKGGNWTPTRLKRMRAGMLVTSAAFFTAALVQSWMDSAEEAGEKLGVYWLLPQYLLITLSEVLVSVSGLEFAYAEAPAIMKGTVMALFLLTTAVGDLCTGALYNALDHMPRRTIFILFAVLMLVNFCGFVFVSRRFARPCPGVRLVEEEGVEMVATPDGVFSLTVGEEEGAVVVDNPFSSSGAVRPPSRDVSSEEDSEEEDE